MSGVQGEEGAGVERYSEGTVRLVRGRWQLVVSAQDPDAPDPPATRRRLTRMTSLTRREEAAARRALVEWRDSLVAEQAVEVARETAPAASGPTSADELVGLLSARLGLNDAQLSRPFDEYAREVTAMRERARGSSPRGRTCCPSYVLETWGLPYLPDAHAQVRSITSSDLNAMVAALAEQGYSPATVQKGWRSVKSVIRHAVNVDGLRPDPSYGIKVASRTRPRINHLPPDEADRLAVALSRGTQTPGVTAARLALAAGIECEASAAIKVGSCDPVSGDAIRIDEVVTRRNDEWVLAYPKNGYRVRTIPMNDEIRSVVSDRLAWMRGAYAVAGQEVGPETFLLADPWSRRGSRPFPTTHGIQQSWRKVAVSMGLVGTMGRVVTIHDLRHTFAVAFLARGGSFADLKAILGHSTGYMTLEVYAQSDPTARAASMEAFGRDLTVPLGS